jgi:hypothetical protein
MISIVTPESLDYVWHKLRPKIELALSTGAGSNFTESYYYNQVNSGIMQMWVFHDPDVIAAGILSVNEYPAGKVLFIELLAGEQLDRWLDLVEPLLKEYAVQIGASTIEALCRPGLVKKLTRWRSVATLMRL